MPILFSSGSPSVTSPSSNLFSSRDPSPSYSVPFTFSLFIVEDLSSASFTPSASLFIPIIRVTIPFGYFIIIGMNLLQALLVKWASPASYSLLSGNINTALPDMDSVRQIYSLPPVQQSTGQQQTDTPIFPAGLSFNFAFSTPFLEPFGTNATIFTIRIKEIMNVPRYLIPLVSLILYSFLNCFSDKNKKPAFTFRETREEKKK